MLFPPPVLTANRRGVLAVGWLDIHVVFQVPWPEGSGIWQTTCDVCFGLMNELF